MSLIDTTNKSAFLYTTSASSQVKKICFPLEEHFQMLYVEYIKIFKDSSYLMLVNGFEKFLEQDFEIQSNMLYGQTAFDILRKLPMTDSYQYEFWSSSEKSPDPIMSLFYAYGMCNGFSTICTTTDYIEQFTFSFDKAANNKADYVLKHISVFNEFINYFKKTAGNLIDCNQKNKLAFFKNRSMVANIWNPDFYSPESLAMQKIFNYIYQDEKLPSYAQTKFSAQEYNCIKYMAEGKTSKEIGKILNLSYRTVESYIAHAKNKIECSYKSQLIEEFYNRNETKSYV